MSEKIEERIADIEAELAKMQYNKATQGHFAVLRARMSQLQNELVERAMKSNRKGSGFAVKKHGDATVILLGFPSVGKSTLLSAITNKESKVAAYEFTTLDAIPGMMEYNGRYKGAKIQIVDLPGIIEGGATGSGRGREIFSTVRNADLIVIMLDATKLEHLEVIKQELYNANIRLDQLPPRITIKERSRGGLLISGHPSVTPNEVISQVLREYRIINADVYLREANLNIEHIIDHVTGNRKYVPSLVIINKVDLISRSDLPKIKAQIGDFVPISADKEIGLEELKEAIVEKIGIMRIYLKRPGQKTDFDDPMIVKKGFTVADLCNKIHKRFKDDFRYANVWGTSVKFPGQKVGLSHVLEDSDSIKIILEK
jgi:hypothetical protein